MTPRIELDVGEIRALLAELGRRLEKRGVLGRIYIAGGAAIALELGSRRTTADIDAIFHPVTTVREQAEAIGRERGLPERWLNDSVGALLPGDDTEAVLLEIPGLSIALASPRHLLAMKMAAFRPRDVADLELLFRELSISSPEEAADIATEVYGPDTVVLPDRDELILSAQAVINHMGRAEK